VKEVRVSPGNARLVYSLAGAVAFAAAQAVLFLIAGQSGCPSMDAAGWFLNSAAGMAAMAAVLAVASSIVGKAVSSPVWRGWTFFVAGGVAALVATVFLLGPGTIFPIVIAAGSTLIAVSAAAGTPVARWLPPRNTSNL
jgi:hypothetical protein